MRSIEWLEKPLWQRSAFQLLAGPKGAGKGTYLAGLAARLSRDGANVLFVSTEDSAEIDLKPRLVAAGADIDRCFLIRAARRSCPTTSTSCGSSPPSSAASGCSSSTPSRTTSATATRTPTPKSATRSRRSTGSPTSSAASSSASATRQGPQPRRARQHPRLDRLGRHPRAVVMIAVDDEDAAVRHIQVVAGNRSLNGPPGVPHRGRRRARAGRADHARRRSRRIRQDRSTSCLVRATDQERRVSARGAAGADPPRAETGEKSREYLNAVGERRARRERRQRLQVRASTPLRKNDQVRARRRTAYGRLRRPAQGEAHRGSPAAGRPPQRSSMRHDARALTHLIWPSSVTMRVCGPWGYLDSPCGGGDV